MTEKPLLGRVKPRIEDAERVDDPQKLIMLFGVRVQTEKASIREYSLIGNPRGMHPVMTAQRNPDPLFKRRHFEQELIILCVRWYISHKLSYRDVTAMMAERGVAVAHMTLLRWTQRYVPEFEKRWMRFARPGSCSGRMDETYIKVRGEWVSL